MVLQRLLFFCSLFFLVGCGSDSKKDRYRIARDPTWYPLQLSGREKNLLAFSDDLIREVSERKGLRFNLVQTNSSQIEAVLRNQKHDGVLTVLEPTPTRRARFLFSDPYFFTGEVLLVPAESSVSSLVELTNKRVGIQRGMLSFYKIEGDDNIIYNQFGSLTAAVEAMLRGELDGVIANLVPAAAFSRGIYQGRVKVVGSPLTQSGIRLVTLKGENDALIDDFNAVIREMLDDGTHRRLREKWGLWQQDEIQLKIMEESASDA